MSHLPFSAIKKRLYVSRLGCVKYVIAVSNYIKEVFHRSFGYPEDRIVVLLNGADTEFLRRQSGIVNFSDKNLASLKMTIFLSFLVE